MNDLHIAVLVGTTRAQRASIQAARYVAEVGASMAGISTELVDPVDFIFPGDGNDPEGKDPKYTAIVDRADGFFIVAPEYNHSFPGSLKRMLDSELALYNHKPVAFAGASSGMWGGVRVIEALVQTTREMGLVASSVDVQFPKVAELFDETGKMKKDAQYRGIIEKAFHELEWLGMALRAARAGDD